MKQFAYDAIDAKAGLVTSISDKIWGYAELSLKEHQSAALYMEALRREGFDVTENVDGIPTAFSASFGSGKPVIGILGEYDALSGLSQKGGAVAREEIVRGGSGHGCQHNLLGAGAMAAALGVKAYLEKTKKPGTVIFYGCPGEEGGASKAFMARDGFFRGLDAALSWHPSDANEVTTGSNIACIQKEYHFKGVAAHAAGDPHLGRSALDAVELMNIGVQYLREHMPQTARVHYAITDGGGASPNVVQPKASVLYMVRDATVHAALALQARVDRIAEAAAMMTGTTYSVTFIDGTANTVPNYRLEKLLYQCFEEIGVPQYDDAERAYAAALVKTYENPPDTLPGFGAQHDAQIAAFVSEKTDGGKAPLNDFLMPPYSSELVRSGSTDVGDVSWLTPTAQIGTVCQASNSPGHSWQNVAVGTTSIAHKGLIVAGKVLASAAISLMENPEILAEARAEFETRAAKGYACPIPEDAVPVAIGEG